MKNVDRGISVVFLIIGAFFFINVLKLPEGSKSYPSFMIGIMTVLALILLINSFFKEPKKTWYDFFGHIQWKRFLLVLMTCLLYLIIVNQLGFFVSTLLYLTGTMIILKASKTTIYIAVPTFMLMLYLVFKTFLNVPLPTGIIV